MRKNLPFIFGVLIFSGCAGTPPAHLGVTNGRLSACPDKPNCVVSHKTDEAHYIAPLAYSDTKTDAYARLKDIILSMPRTRITLEKPDYLRAEFTSAVMGFVDDVEFYFPDEPLIHVRSASRLGYSDFGVNRKRIETIRREFNKP